MTHATTPTRTIPWRILWAAPALLLTLPLAAGAPWTLSDYIAMGAMLGIAGLLVELGVHLSRGSWAYRAGACVAVAAGFLLVWVNLAVGFLGDEDNPANLMFAGVLIAALIGALIARFRAAGLARTMFVAAGLQVLVAAIAFAAGWASPGIMGFKELVLGTGMFAALWIVAGALFRRAAR